VIVVAALFYVAGREEAGPRIFRSFVVGVLVLFAFQVTTVLAKIGQLRTVVHERSLDVGVAMGIGVWALLVAGALIFMAGLRRAVAIAKRTEPRRSTYVPTSPR
jgi:TRAP-type C4-dicarboxylate transport system permease small subunit